MDLKRAQGNTTETSGDKVEIDEARKDSSLIQSAVGPKRPADAPPWWPHQQQRMKQHHEHNKHPLLTPQAKDAALRADLPRHSALAVPDDKPGSQGQEAQTGGERGCFCRSDVAAGRAVPETIPAVTHGNVDKPPCPACGAGRESLERKLSLVRGRNSVWEEALKGTIDKAADDFQVCILKGRSHEDEMRERQVQECKDAAEPRPRAPITMVKLEFDSFGFPGVGLLGPGSSAGGSSQGSQSPVLPPGISEGMRSRLANMSFAWHTSGNGIRGLTCGGSSSSSSGRAKAGAAAAVVGARTNAEPAVAVSWTPSPRGSLFQAQSRAGAGAAAPATGAAAPTAAPVPARRRHRQAVVLHLVLA